MFESLTKGFRQAMNRLAGLTDASDGIGFSASPTVSDVAICTPCPAASDTFVKNAWTFAVVGVPLNNPAVSSPSPGGKVLVSSTLHV